MHRSDPIASKSELAMTKPSISAFNRRNWILGCIAVGATHGRMGFGSDDTSRVGNRFRVRTVIKTHGEVRLKSQIADATSRNGKPSPAKTVPMQATTNLDYEEDVLLNTPLSESKAYLRIAQADSEVQVDRHITKTKLRDTCLDIVRICNDQGLSTACLDNPLFAAERDLLEPPINSMFLDKITTKSKVKISDKWQMEEEAACRLLGLDAVLDGEITVCLVDANDSTAQLDLKGTIAGSIRQVATTIVLEAKAQVDRKSHCVTWFAANLEETRDIGEYEPGFKVLAQVQVRRAPIEELSNGESLASIESRIPTKENADLLQFQSDLGYYRFLANRKWTTYRDNGEEATFRYVIDNQRVAQCNVTNMVDMEPGKQLSMEGFVSDVKKSLEGMMSELLESSESLTSSKLRAIKVTSRGTVQGVDIVWIHYHLSNDNGRRAVLVFMLNAEQMETFASEDAQIVSTFELIDWPKKIDRKALEIATAENSESTSR